MAVVKTAVSLQETLFEKLEKLTRELNVSRSGLLSLALEEYIERYENLKMLQTLNDVYADGMEEELQFSELYRDKFREIIEGSW